MGYGGDLMFSAVLRELKKKYPEKKIYLTNSKIDKLQKILFGNFFYISKNKSPIFQNNPNINFGFIKKNSIVVDRFDIKYSYAKKEFRDRYIFEKKKHAVKLILEKFNINSNNVNPEIFFSKEEIDIYRKKFEFLDKVQFITIEPNVKSGFLGKNRKWKFNNWQLLIDSFKDLNFIQVGNTIDQNLNNLYYNFNTKLTLRETIYIIKKSYLFLGTDSGLMHAANAAKTKSLILFHRILNKKVISYSENINLSLEVPCKNCGFKEGYCPNNNICMDFKVEDVSKILNKIIKNSY